MRIKTVANTTKQENFPDFTFFLCCYKIRNMYGSSGWCEGGKTWSTLLYLRIFCPKNRKECVSVSKSGRLFFRMEKPLWNIPAP